MKKSIFVITLCLSMVLLMFTGCNTPSTTAPTTAAPTTTKATAAPTTAGPTTTAATTAELKPLKLKYATAEQKNMAAGQTSYWVVEQIESRTNNRIDIDHIGESKLGTDGDLILQLFDGTLDIVAIGTSAFSTYTLVFDVIQCPFLLNSYENQYKLFTSNEFMDIVADVEKQFDIKFLGFAENGMRQFATIAAPVTKVADLKGLKLRVINTKILTDYMRALGANPTILPYTEIYSGLQNRVIDGEEVNISSAASQKHYEVIKYISVANMYPFPATYWMSGKTYRAIPQADFEIIRQSFMDGSKRCFEELLYDLDEKFMKECLDAGVTFNNIEGAALQEFKDIAEPFIDEYRKIGVKVNALIDFALKTRDG